MKSDWNLPPGVTATDIDPPRLCPKCGGRIEDEATWCHWCCSDLLDAPDNQLNEDDLEENR